MTIERDILDGFNKPVVERSKLFIPLLFLFVLYFGFLILDLFIDLEHLSLKKEDPKLPILLFTLILPGIGFIFFIAKWKLGWFISLVFFLFILFLVITTTITEIIRNRGNYSNSLFTVRQLFILILVTCISIFLLSKSIRIYFKIKSWVLITAISISVGLAVMVITLR